MARKVTGNAIVPVQGDGNRSNIETPPPFVSRHRLLHLLLIQPLLLGGGQSICILTLPNDDNVTSVSAPLHEQLGQAVLEPMALDTPVSPSLAENVVDFEFFCIFVSESLHS